MGSIRFSTTLVPRGQGRRSCATRIKSLPSGHGATRFPVRATVNGYTWRRSVFRMVGEFMVGLNRGVRDGA